jgi:hypothetical protein
VIGINFKLLMTFRIILQNENHWLTEEVKIMHNIKGAKRAFVPEIVNFQEKYVT